MTSPRLGISSSATPAEIKAAYHAKLKNFQPIATQRNSRQFSCLRCHSPGESSEADDFFFLVRPSKRLLTHSTAITATGGCSVGGEFGGDDSRNVLRRMQG